MADFRRWIYALAVVALLAGLSVPASAQIPPFACITSVSVAPIVRAEGYTELTGDLVLNCTGGQPTAANQPVPQVNFTVFLNTNITSRVLAANLYDEALLIMDEPNTNLRTPPNPILNCGHQGAGDGGPSGPAVCNIRSTGIPAQTYDGTPNAYGTTGTCGTGVLPAANTYGCGRPNVFQGRMGTPQNAGQLNAVAFLGVPLDPPGTTTNRTIRVTNIRANAVAIGVSTTFTTAQIQANISVNGPTTMTISNPQQIVAYVNRGLTFEIPSNGTIVSTGGVRLRNRLDFVQCVSENPDLFLATPSPNFSVPVYRGFEGANFVGGVDLTPTVRFIEGFASSWKTKNIAFHSGGFGAVGNGLFDAATNSYKYNQTRNYPADLGQDIPGAVYNTESGFRWDGVGTNATVAPTTNPPPGYGFSPVNLAISGNTATRFDNSSPLNLNNLDTGIDEAGRADSGTRLSLLFNNIPSGAGVWLPPVIYLFRQGSPYQTANNNPNPTSVSGGLGIDPYVAGLTGVMVLTNTDAAGAGAFARTQATGTNELNLAKVGTSNLGVYEVLYTDPFSLELADVPTVVAYSSNINQNLPTPGVTTTVTAGFAPFYSSTAAGQPTPNAQFSTPTHIPRFTPGTGPRDLFLINKCACNLLFPYVVSAAGFDTGIAIANSSSDPGATYGFFGVPQPGTVTFWYYGVMANGGAVPGPQTSKSVPSGQVLTYVASSGSTDWGLDSRAAGLIGYVITQAQFQYCHAFAYISALGAGPLTPGTSEGYLGIVLDAASLNRTNQVGENKAH